MPNTNTSQLDPQAVMLAKAIRQTESGGNFSAKGKSGEFGAYQYTAPTWSKDAAAAGVSTPLDEATKEDQNKVAYTKIKALKDRGLNIGQIASAWNAGEGEHDAYTGKFSNGSPSTGVNKYGVKFDVPAYAKSVATAYQTLKSGGQVNVDPNNPSSTSGAKEVATGFAEKHPILNAIGDALTHSERGFGQDIAGAIIPHTDAQTNTDAARSGLTDEQNRVVAQIQKDRAQGKDTTRLEQALKSTNGVLSSDEELNPTLNKSTEQILGDAGGTLGDILSFGSYGKAALAGKSFGLAKEIPEAIKGVTKAQGIFQGLKAGAKSGAIIGAAQGITGGMQGNGSAGDIAKQGLVGTLIGGASGGLLGGAGGLIASHTPENAVAGLASKYKKIFNSVAPLRRLYDQSTQKGNDIADFIASKARGSEGAALQSSEDGVVSVGELPAKIEADMQPLLAARKMVLDSSGQTANLNEWEQRALKAADSENNRSQGVVQDTQDAIRKVAANVRSSYGENVPLGALQDIKIGQGKASKVFDMSKPNYAKNANYLLSNEARKIIEEKTPQLGDESSAVADLNKHIGKHLDALDLLEQIKKSAPKVKGGRLGKYFASSLGGMVGSAMGTGPIGTLAGAGAGNYIAELLLSNSISSPMKSLLYKYAKTANPEILKTVESLLSKQQIERLSRKLLPASSQINARSAAKAPDTSGIDREGTKKLEEFYKQQAMQNTKRLPAPPIQMSSPDTSGINITVAKKGLPAADPKTGRMFRTYTSESNGVLSKVLEKKKK